MRVADFITDRIYQAGAKTVFLLTGGYQLTISDALLLHPEQEYVCCLHEQAVAMAADGYARMTGRIGAGYVTLGPGPTNALTGVANAYLDSVPCIFVSGQQKLQYVQVEGPRQFGFQGFPTLPLFKPITKYAVLIDDIRMVKYELDKALHLAVSGRPGPVWIEVPADIQSMPFNPALYEDFVPFPAEDSEKRAAIEEMINETAHIIRKSDRPLILAGAGIRMARAIEALHRFLDQTNIPVMTSRGGMDLLDDSHPLFVGRPGHYGCRPANFAVENCDVFVSVGCRLNILHVGYNFETFARQAKKIIVDIDEQETGKPSINPDLAIAVDAGLFLEKLAEALKGYRHENPRWIGRINDWKERYPVVLPQYKHDPEGVNTYYLFDKLSEKVSSRDIFVLDACSAYYTFPQAFKVKFGQRHMITGGLGTMGFMPAAIGAAIAVPDRDVYCICGDGSIQLNMQEFQTILYHHLPIKLIILSNGGYLCIRLTQTNFFGSRFIGSGEADGLSLPSMEKIAWAYGMKYLKISETSEMNAGLDELVATPGPLLCEITMPENQLLIPRIESKRLDDGTMISMPFDDMYPYLPREEYVSNHNSFDQK